MANKIELLTIFINMIENEKEDGLNPKITNNNKETSYKFDNIHFVFINKVTLAFNEINLDENLRFYIDEEAVGAIAIDNIGEIMEL